jgi:hypothetical protein
MNISLKKIVAEIVKSPSYYDVYNSSYTKAIEQIKNYLERAGATYDENEFFQAFRVGVGNLYKDQTLDRKIEVTTKKGQTRYLCVQIYRMSDSTWELNMYIS